MLVVEGVDVIIMCQLFLVSDSVCLVFQVESDIEWIKVVIIVICNICGEMCILLGKVLDVYLYNGKDIDCECLVVNYNFMCWFVKLECIIWLNVEDFVLVFVIGLVGDMEILVLMVGLIDKDVEIECLGKEIDKLCKEVVCGESKLCNFNFVDKVFDEVVVKECEKLDDYCL